MKLISTTALALPLLVLGSAPQTVLAEDATVVAPEHYKVEFENDKVRVIRVTYGPGEESALHEHRDAVVVNLTDLSVQFTMADGTKPAVEPGQAGGATWSPAQMHAAKNMGGRAEALLIELKN